MTNHMQPDDQQSPTTEATPAPAEALAVPAALAASTPLTPAAAITTDTPTGMAPATADRQGRAIVLMCAVSFIFAIQDALSRHLGSNYSTYFVVMLRYWFFAVFAVVLVARSPGGIRAALRSPHPVAQTLRGLILVAEVVLMLAPETNGEVAVKAWEALSKATGRSHKHLAEVKEDEKIRFRDIQAQPRKIISSPIWSGLESEHVCYNAGYTNVHELIPWRTLSGRQQLYQDHEWMRAFGEGFVTWRPPVDLKTVGHAATKSLGSTEKHVVLNFLTPHQKWGIHSTYSENLRMLTLSRGGPHVWFDAAVMFVFLLLLMLAWMLAPVLLDEERRPAA